MTAKGDAEDMRGRILQGALEVFSEKGYSVATIKDVSARAGCNPVTIYRYFKDKQTLFLQVTETFSKLEYDEEYILSKLSYTNVHTDLAVMADMFFKILLRNIHIMRIFINDGAHFQQISRRSWFLPAPVKNFVEDYIFTVYPHQIPPQDVSLISEMFVAFITRTCLRVNVHDGVMEFSKKIADEARDTMYTSVDMILNIIMLHVKQAPPAHSI